MLIRRMIKILFIVCFLASPLWAQVTSENDTVRFKFNPTSFDDPDVLEKAIELFWYDAGTGIKEFVAMAANLKGEKFIQQDMKSSAQGELTVDLSKLAAGQYFCTLTSGEVVISKAFMKR